MRCIEIIYSCCFVTIWERLIETWDVLKSAITSVKYADIGINRNMRCIEMLVNEIMTSAGGD